MSESSSYIVCGQCGTHNVVTDDFCSSDGYFLGHGDSRRIDPPAPQAPSPVVPAAGPGRLTRVIEAITGPDQPRDDSPPPPTPGRAPTATPPLTPQRDAEPSPAPVAEHRTPTAVQPERDPTAATRPGRAPRTTPTLRPPETLEPGQLVCGACGTGNAPARHFCRRCGTALADAVVHRQRWWQRGPRARPVAGDRPRSRRRGRPPIITILVLLALVGAAIVFRGYLVQAVGWSLDQLREPTPVSPIGVTASSETPESPAAAAFDGASNQPWRPADQGPADGSWIEADLGSPVRVVTMIVTPGASTVQADFLAGYRPRDVRVDATLADGSVTTLNRRLEDAAGAATIDINTADVVRVRLTTLTSYGREGQLAIAEIELFTR